jgi:hypothetical protein
MNGHRPTWRLDRRPSASAFATPGRELGLDDDRQWLRFDELNYFDWPAFDLSPVPGTDARYDYGMLPRRFFERVRVAILNRVRVAKRTAVLNRDE